MIIVKWHGISVSDDDHATLSSGEFALFTRIMSRNIIHINGEREKNVGAGTASGVVESITTEKVFHAPYVTLWKTKSENIRGFAVAVGLETFVGSIFACAAEPPSPPPPLPVAMTMTNVPQQKKRKNNRTRPRAIRRAPQLAYTAVRNKRERVALCTARSAMRRREREINIIFVQRSIKTATTHGLASSRRAAPTPSGSRLAVAVTQRSSVYFESRGSVGMSMTHAIPDFRSASNTKCGAASTRGTFDFSNGEFVLYTMCGFIIDVYYRRNGLCFGYYNRTRVTSVGNRDVTLHDRSYVYMITAKFMTAESITNRS
ncbi:unnamed protein product [Trichogramma brassicae]|uniref:Uncharacterized protein n=1 Tax=Trichogramma brassicae TaxID=86971 RepID=A0A6H5IFA5_9HYME|nr:unnamed protein product [Trichogramma brassicae]